MVAHQFFFSPHILDNLAPPRAGFIVVQDIAEPHLRMYITARGVKTFFVRRRMNGRDVRIIIGRYPEIDVFDARARVAAALYDSGNVQKSRSKKITFGAAAKQFVSKKIRRAPESKAKLIRAMEHAFVSLYPIYLNDITAVHATKIIDNIARESGAPTANRMREIMSGIFKFACADNNPAAEIAPFKELRRARTLNITGLRRLVSAINAEPDVIIRAAFLMLIYGFANRSKIFSMRWSDMDFNNDNWGTVPLSDAAVVVLRDLPQNKQYVFPGAYGRGHLTDPRSAWRRVVMRAKLKDVQMSDVHRFMMKRLEWSADRETLRQNMNESIEQII
ncbi:MAG: hypothetical protein FWE52_03965 [Alphaproteobacteria bacterium]|nr:hypothetical protein [Alphaproteobacteria bacterium]